METMKKADFDKLPKGYKTKINGQDYVLKLKECGTCLVPIKVIK